LRLRTASQFAIISKMSTRLNLLAGEDWRMRYAERSRMIEIFTIGVFHRTR
jgi:hypothetical protein